MRKLRCAIALKKRAGSGVRDLEVRMPNRVDASNSAIDLGLKPQA